MPTGKGPAGQTVSIKHLMDPLNAANVKQYYVNDADGDTTSIFHAQAAAQASDWCLEERFEYATVSGVKNIVKHAFQDAVWDASYDLSF